MKIRELTGVAADYTIGTIIVMGHFMTAGRRARAGEPRMPMRSAARRDRARDDSRAAQVR